MAKRRSPWGCTLTVGGDIDLIQERELDDSEDWPVIFNQRKGNSAER
jgi:hypothetical protein